MLRDIQKKFDVNVLRSSSLLTNSILKELDARVDAQREQVKVALQQLQLRVNDASKIMEANDKLTQLSVEKEKARLEIANREELRKSKKKSKINNNKTYKLIPQTQLNLRNLCTTNNA